MICVYFFKIFLNGEVKNGNLVLIVFYFFRVRVKVGF